MPQILPIQSCYDSFLQLRSQSKTVIVSSPTGSGKSTRVPLWAAKTGTVLVIEPRRVVARALAMRIAEETATEPGTLAGWVVRGDARRQASTQILFVTPGVALRMLGQGELAHFDTWILDEFHERRSDVDALLAWMRWQNQLHRVVLLSATLDVPTLARELGAEVLCGQGRVFPVDIEYRGGLGQTWPDADALPLRLERALRSLDAAEGAVLVFLPGTSEISDAAAWLEGRLPGQILQLHGGLSIDQQQRVLHPGTGLRIVLTTNVAESALTVPDVIAVIDSGLERRVVRSNGFPSLELQPISQASADQRAGRAGRTAAGRCLRLWSEAARLEPRPRPGIQVDDPDDWLLPILAAGANPAQLPWLDKPRADGIREALERFRRAGIWAPDPWNPMGGKLTDCGREALELPLPPDLAGFCLGMVGTSGLRDAVALACGLAQARPLLQGKPTGDRLRERQAWAPSDLALLASAVRANPEVVRAIGVRLPVWREVRELWERLEAHFQLTTSHWPREFQSDRIIQGLYQLEPRSLRLRRGPAGHEEYALGDGPGLRPSRSSLALAPAPELALAVSTHGGLDHQGRRRVWIEAAEGLTKERALRLELGRVEVIQAERRENTVWARWKLRVGSVVLGQKEGEAIHPRVWAQAVTKSLGSLDTLQKALDDLWLARCLEFKTWIAPPEDAATWLQRNLEIHPDAAQAPRWPKTLPSPAIADLEKLQQAYPTSLEGPGGVWLARWEVRTGKLRLTAPTKRKAPVPSLVNSPGWTLKVG